MYWCYYGDGTPPQDGCPICADNDLAATNICQSEDFLDDPNAFAQEAPCYLPNSCSSWNPGSGVTVNKSTGNKVVYQTFLDSVIADPNLLGCDGASFEAASGGGFVLSGASPGGLLYGLGFRDGDQPTSINGYSVDSFAEVAAAFVGLSSSAPSQYTIVVNRSGTPLTIVIDIW